MFNSLKLIIRCLLFATSMPFRIVSYLLFIGCVFTWIARSTEPGAVVSQIIGTFCHPIRPILPWGGLVPLGAKGFYIDFAPIPMSAIVLIPAWITDQLRGARILAWKRPKGWSKTSTND